MTRARVTLLLGMLVLLCQSPRQVATAGTQDDAVIALHVQGLAGKANPCTSPNSPTVGCSSYTTNWPLFTPANVYMVVARGNPGIGISGLSVGLEYDLASFKTVTWTSCNTVEFPLGGWPGPGSGNQIIWTLPDCQTTDIPPDSVHAVAGFFYVYAYENEVFRLTGNQAVAADKDARVSDCPSFPLTESILSPDNLGSVGFGLFAGYNPCGTRIGIPEDDPVVELNTLRLGPVLPNPFTLTTRIYANLPKDGHVNLTIYDVAGRLVRTLANGDHPAGRFEAAWDGRGWDGKRSASGVYFIKLKAGTETNVAKVVLGR